MRNLIGLRAPHLMKDRDRVGCIGLEGDGKVGKVVVILGLMVSLI